MKSLVALAATVVLGFTLGVGNAEAAKRLGAGKSSGMQRQAVSPQKPAAAAPSAAAAQGAGAAQAASKRSWMGPLAGLAAGLGLAALASHLGFGEELASMLMIGLLVMAAIAVVGFLLRRRATAGQPAMAGAGGMQYAASGPDFSRAGQGASVPPSSLGASGAAAASGTSGSIPADFDTEAFVRNAKVNYIRLQAANDAGNLDDIREFTTPEMFGEIKMDIVERAGVAQVTDVVSLEATVVEVAEEAERYVVSVRFGGLVREESNGPAEPIDEIWHMVKPRDGSRGWTLAGIQQVQ